MKKQTVSSFGTAFFLLLLTCLHTDLVMAQKAGIAQYTFGDVAVTKSSGIQTALQKGSNIDSGDAIVTGPNAQAQIRFTDTGMVAIQANSRFKVASYANNNDTKTDSFVVELLRGGLRAISGLIGKRNHDNYAVKTPTATIGIRGSSFLIAINDDSTVSVNAEEDEIVVCDNAGCVDLTAGESVVVIDPNELPKRTFVRPKFDDFYPPDLLNPVWQGNKLFVMNNQQADFAWGNMASAVNGGLTPGNYSTSNPDGLSKPIFIGQPLVSYLDITPGSNLGGSNISSFNSTGSPASPDYIGWGYWAQGSYTSGGTTNTLQDVHYIVGNPTPVAQMPMNISFTYNLVGGTVPTLNNGTSTIYGTLNSATFNVDFNSGATTYVGLTVNTSFNGTTYSHSFGSSGNQRFGYSYLGLGFYGMFVGNGASKAGVVYNFSALPTTGPSVGTISGSAVFNKGPRSPNCFFCG